MLKTKIRAMEKATRLTPGVKANQSVLFRRMLIDHARLAPEMAKRDWIAATLRFRGEGITKPDGALLENVYVRQVWDKVDRLVPRLAAKAAAKEASRKATPARPPRIKRPTRSLPVPVLELAPVDYEAEAREMQERSLATAAAVADLMAKIEERAVAAKQLAAASIARLQPKTAAPEPPEFDLEDPEYLEAIAESEQDKRESERAAWRAMQRGPAASVWGEMEQAGRDARGLGRG